MNINSGELDTGKHSSEVRAPYPVVMVDIRIANMMGFHTVWEAEDFQALNEKTKDWQIYQYVDGRWRRVEKDASVEPGEPESIEEPVEQAEPVAEPLVEEEPVPDIQVEVSEPAVENEEIPSEEPEKVIIEEDLTEMQAEEAAPEITPAEEPVAEVSPVSEEETEPVSEAPTETHLPKKPQEYVGAELAEEQVPVEEPKIESSPEEHEEELVGLPADPPAEALVEEAAKSGPKVSESEHEMTLDELFEELVPKKRMSDPEVEIQAVSPESGDKVLSIGVTGGANEAQKNKKRPEKKADPKSEHPETSASDKAESEDRLDEPEKRIPESKTSRHDEPKKPAENVSGEFALESMPPEKKPVKKSGAKAKKSRKRKPKKK